MITNKTTIILAGVLALAIVGLYGLSLVNTEQPLGYPPDISLNTEAKGQDYWVWIAPEDRFSMEEDNNKGIIKKGDIIDIQPVTSQYEPTDGEKNKFIIIKVNGITAENMAKYTESWGEYNEEKGVDDSVAYRKWRGDVDTLQLSVGMDSDSKDPTSFDNYVTEKTQQDLIAYERGRKAYVLKNKPKQLAKQFYNYIIPPALAATESISCINCTADCDASASTCGGTEDYNTLTLWEADTDVDITGVGSDTLVIANCYDDDGVLDDKDIDLNGATTNATNYRKITAPVGERHNGKVVTDGGAGSGFTLDPTVAVVSNGSVIQSNDNYDVFEWIRIVDWAGTVFTNGNGMTKTTGTFSEFNNNIIHDNDGSINANYNGIYDVSFTSNNDYALLVANNMVINMTSNGRAARCFLLRASIHAYNNTAYNCASGGFVVEDRTPVLYNNVAANNSGNDYVKGAGNDFAVESDYNAATDAAGTGYGSNNIYNLIDDDTFVDIASGTEDLHLKTGSLLIEGGSDQSATITIDIDNDDRPQGALWDIGADEFIAEAGGERRFYKVD